MKIIIVGAGQVGFHIASRLAVEHKDVVVIDRNPQAIKRLSDEIDVRGIVGEGDSPAVLEEAGIKGAESLLAVTDSDDVNLVACLTANMISPNTRKFARLRSPDFDNYHESLKNNPPFIEAVINPEIEAVKTIVRLIKVPSAIESGEFVDGRVKFIGFRLDENSSMDDVRLYDLKEKLGDIRALVAAIVRDEKLIIPEGKSRLKSGDLIYLITDKENLGPALNAFGKDYKPVKKVMIIGGGELGKRLAYTLEDINISTKIVDIDEERCRFLADTMNKTIVLNGDGSDQSLLLEESIHNMDMVISLTGDEETNILVSLLAKRMGAGGVITKILKFSYFSLMPAIGIEKIVSPRLSAIDSFLQHIRRGKVLSAVSINGEQAEVMEAVALETSGIVGKPLHKLSFPKGALIIGIIRDEKIEIPSGESIIYPNDRVIIFSDRKAVLEIEKILSVKLEYF
ncbi:MAG: Trk system potassium transporter TrkA [Deltaproteobacteria bacterium]|nr:MAG: Trk system potassium transporter TrkA [Deltaproteobacteria bacterium]PIE75010.1 MAG: Trk system potassium transporter TrkA [Deltaproteobacteria bacterium]